MGKVARNFALIRRSGGDRPKRRLDSNSASSPDYKDGEENNEEDGMGRRNSDWAPSTSAVFKLLFSMRLSSSLWGLISDCDEVYNYWEPLHLLLFGRGFQTWEYSPTYAIRSWLYILFHAVPARFLLPLFPGSKVSLFFSLRFLIGFATLLSELMLFRTICSRLGNSLGRTYILFSLFSAAMFNASCAFLPSSFSMMLNSFAIVFYLRQQWFMAILCTATSALIGWPFAALLGLPLVIEMLLIRPKQLAIKFATYSLVVGVALVGALLLVDSHFFGHPVVAPFNIILYNMFSPNGPNLYGVEPASFYFRNLLLNFNLALPLALLSLPFMSIIFFFVGIKDEKRRKDGGDAPATALKRFIGLTDWPLTQWHNFRPLLLLLITASIWLLIFLLQPHKEERFLFPIYPHICLLAAFSLEYLSRCLPGRRLPFLLTIAVLSVFLLASLSRMVALHRNYSGIIDTYKEFNDKMAIGQLDLPAMGNGEEQKTLLRLCVGKEWHRFPSSFFLPEQFGQRRGFELEFVRSEFRGLLPGHFANGPIPNITQRIPADQNDQNREETSRYVPIESCDFLLDLEVPEPTELEPDYSKMPAFQSVVQRRVLLAAQSHPLFRAFYIPFSPKDFLKFGTFHLLRRVQNG